MKNIVLVILLVSLFSGCILDPYSYGTVKYLENENVGIYGIQGASGGRYIPINLPDNYKKNDFKIEFLYEKADVSIPVNWGVPIILNYVNEDN